MPPGCLRALVLQPSQRAGLEPPPLVCFQIPLCQVLRESHLSKDLVVVRPNVLSDVLGHGLGNPTECPITVCKGDKIGIVVAKRHGCNPNVVLAMHAKALCLRVNRCSFNGNTSDCPVLIVTSGTTCDAVLESHGDVASAANRRKNRS